MYEELAGHHWDVFYSMNQNNFFKDRHYLEKVFPELNCLLTSDNEDELARRPTEIGALMQLSEKRKTVIAEVGCGVGNAILPMIEKTMQNHQQQMQSSTISASFHFVATDISPVAIDILRSDARYRDAPSYEVKVDSAVWDITDSPENIPSCIVGVADATLVLFCLSAVSPDKTKQAAHNIASTLRPGGTLLFRDYGRYDEAQMKLGSSRGKQIGANFYVKHDGTRCYYFVLENLSKLFGQGPDGAGLEEKELKYIRRKYFNRGESSVRRRVWVQARFRKPIL